MEITSGIHRIDGVRGANCYLVITESKMLVIDTGMPGNGNKITKYVRGLGKNPSDISYVILTHADIDHIGSAAEMKRITGAKLGIHANDAPILSGKRGFRTIRGPLLVRVLFKVMTRLMRFHSVEPDVILGDDFELDGLKVIHTPGHTDGSICLYLPPKLIFVGDALRSNSKGNPKPLSKVFSADITQAKASLKAISELEFDICLTGHGAPIVGSASTKIKNLLTHLK
jgi:glyoxylase-like metal-dependent hydrolase (beta-lactamase superfamily II)